MISELSAKHNEFVSQLKTEVSLELRESMEAAHQAELQQVQVYYMQTHKPKHYSFSQPLLFFNFFIFLNIPKSVKYIIVLLNTDLDSSFHYAFIPLGSKGH